MGDGAAGVQSAGADQPGPRLGVDFGRVINDASSHPGGDDTAFLDGSEEEMLSTPVMPGALDALRRLSDAFEGRVWIVSKCGVEIQRRTERWLAHHRFLDRTGIPPDHLRFCRRRPDKAGHCAELGITHFVDDSPEVLGYLVGVVAHLYLFGPQEGEVPAGMVATPTWPDALRAIMLTLPSGR